MRLKNKRGISEIVSYVLLIIIGVTLSVIVYAYLIKFIPKEQESCPDGVSIIVKNIECKLKSGSEFEVNITLYNKGLWNVSKISMRADIPDKKVKTKIIKKDFLFPPLAPGMTTNYNFTTNQLMEGEDYEVEIEPIMISQKTRNEILCSNAIITQPFSCQ